MCDLQKLLRCQPISSHRNGDRQRRNHYVHQDRALGTDYSGIMTGNSISVVTRRTYQ